MILIRTVIIFGQMVPPMPRLRGTGAWWSVVIRASEFGKPGKTGEFDSSVALDLPCHQHLAIGLHQLHRQLRSQAAVFPMNVATIRKLDMDVFKDLNLTQLRPDAVLVPPHGRQRGSRSSWSPLEIPKRGGWKSSFTSVRRYEKQARLNLPPSEVLAGMPRKVTHIEAQHPVAWTRL